MTLMHLVERRNRLTEKAKRLVDECQWAEKHYLGAVSLEEVRLSQLGVSCTSTAVDTSFDRKLWQKLKMQCVPPLHHPASTTGCSLSAMPPSYSFCVGGAPSQWADDYVRGQITLIHQALAESQAYLVRWREVKNAVGAILYGVGQLGEGRAGCAVDDDAVELAELDGEEDADA